MYPTFLFYNELLAPLDFLPTISDPVSWEIVPGERAEFFHAHHVVKNLDSFLVTIEGKECGKLRLHTGFNRGDPASRKWRTAERFA